MTPLLNIGCGTTFHADWVNLDAAPAAPGIVAHDLAAGLPFSDGHFEAVYASHVLEHFDPEGGERLLHECFRVLRPGGIARIVVPDLEVIVRTYLDSLERAAAGDPEGQARYDWMMLELYDQVVRTESGGKMAAYLAGPLDEGRRQFVAGRIGDEAVNAVRSESRVSILRRVRAGLASALLGPRRAAALGEAAFRRNGEVHQWMYDRFSLARALRRAGFHDARQRAADQSDIPDFPRYGLETNRGRARKPDSLYFECRKP